MGKNISSRDVYWQESGYTILDILLHPLNLDNIFHVGRYFCILWNKTNLFFWSIFNIP